jgi:hypothetical protein
LLHCRALFCNAPAPTNQPFLLLLLLLALPRSLLSRQPSTAAAVLKRSAAAWLLPVLLQLWLCKRLQRLAELPCYCGNDSNILLQHWQPGS